MAKTGARLVFRTTPVVAAERDLPLFNTRCNMQIKKVDAEALLAAISVIDKIAKSKKTTPEEREANHVQAIKVLRAVAKVLKV